MMWLSIPLSQSVAPGPEPPTKQPMGQARAPPQYTYARISVAAGGPEQVGRCYRIPAALYRSRHSSDLWSRQKSTVHLDGRAGRPWDQGAQTAEEGSYLYTDRSGRKSFHPQRRLTTIIEPN
ncbi:hypothetical protein CMQ_1786 [Grosmannia clavigera kw1407]|uniref:Uncharacterized protein n=1 Tax=Grosmannia clavigera (strain kw1407 / UAMH 11150) TaxID=655863 RepID=F0XAZ6_GROCL|nr:uncharacterized protein CMQ_1786 [Grosmannia clavigera kw1407]EFX05150.1 hypothetical protein CMQ_1786 [Grosmannia clavigera kw1407]